MTTESAPGPLAGGDGRARRRERNAARLYAAADELLATRSFDEVSVDEICARASVGRATFFRIFETKAGLLRELNRRLARDAAERIAESGSHDIHLQLEQVRCAIVEAWRHAGPGHLGMARELVRSISGDDLHAAHPELAALVRDLIVEAIRSGQLPDTVPAPVAASLALMHLSAPIAYAISGERTDIDRLSRTLLGQWLTGMTEWSADATE